MEDDFPFFIFHLSFVIICHLSLTKGANDK